MGRKRLVTESRLVAIVDDEQDITILFREALMTIKGITLFTFTDPLLALEHFLMSEHSYVLVISDFRMPGLDGMELLRKVKESNKVVRTILMTAFALDDNFFKEYARREIINGFLQKPIGLNDLRNEVIAQLNAYELRKKKSKKSQ
ncbi:MAG TPA: response regulator [Nitrososphaeraceae archaeon]|nr:response regulator [Nitrososphaeraceae archaeon]